MIYAWTVLLTVHCMQAGFHAMHARRIVHPPSVIRHAVLDPNCFAGTACACCHVDERARDIRDAEALSSSSALQTRVKNTQAQFDSSLKKRLDEKKKKTTLKLLVALKHSGKGLDKGRRPSLASWHGVSVTEGGDCYKSLRRKSAGDWSSPGDICRC